MDTNNTAQPNIPTSPTAPAPQNNVVQTAVVQDTQNIQTTQSAQDAVLPMPPVAQPSEPETAQAISPQPMPAASATAPVAPTSEDLTQSATQASVVSTAPTIAEPTTSTEPAISSSILATSESSVPTQPIAPQSLEPTPIFASSPAQKVGLFQRIFGPKKSKSGEVTSPDAEAELAKIALHTIADGVIIINRHNQISLINPAAITMTKAHAPEVTLGLGIDAILVLETADGPLPEGQQNPFMLAVNQGKEFSSREYLSVTEQGHKIPVALTVMPAVHGDKIITLRNIAKELEEESEQAEFISTASHEMRTPVASIEGYIGLAMNPQTATIDDRARQYLDAAHSASQHLGKLFKDLLDVTKLDDKKLRVHPVPVEMGKLVEKIISEYTNELAQKNLKLTFGTKDNDKNHLRQPAYAMVDIDFLREILSNLIENATKYTPEGGAVWVNVRPDSNDVLINVTDTGMGIAPDDLTHIFQKFYRVDNSQTRTIGGTGLGLYIVKQRVEAMNGRVWAESSFGDGSTFYVAFPRLSELDYQKAKMAYDNNQAMGLGQATINSTEASQPNPNTPPSAPTVPTS